VYNVQCCSSVKSVILCERNLKVSFSDLITFEVMSVIAFFIFIVLTLLSWSCFGTSVYFLKFLLLYFLQLPLLTCFPSDK